MVPYQIIFESLSKENIQYLVAGGFAVNFHQTGNWQAPLNPIEGTSQSGKG